MNFKIEELQGKDVEGAPCFAFLKSKLNKFGLDMASMRKLAARDTILDALDYYFFYDDGLEEGNKKLEEEA